MSMFHALLSAGFRDYYVSSLGTGTGVGTQADPFTATQLVSVLATLPVRSNILFKRGETHDMTALSVTKAFSFDAYGSGALPIIRGSQAEGAWTLDSGNIYWMSSASAPLWVYAPSGQEATLARTQELLINTYNGTTGLSFAGASLTAINAINATESIVGAGIWGDDYVFRPNFRGTVQAYSTPNLTTAATYAGEAGGSQPGNKLRLYNKKSFLAAANEWMYDAAAQRIYYRTAGGAPSGVRVCYENKAFNISDGVSGVSIRNINFTQWFEAGIYSLRNDDLVIDGCSFNDIRIHGITMLGASDGVSCINNTLTRISNNAIHVGALQNSDISSNTITSIGVQSTPSFAYYTTIFRSVGNGIHTRWDVTENPSTPDNVTYRYNNIQDVGYCGVTYCGINQTYEYNYVLRAGTVWEDGGGIYGRHLDSSWIPAWAAWIGTSGGTNNITIQNNIVEDSLFTGGAGIYCDNNAHLITVHNNTILGSLDAGILINWGNKQHTVTNNLVMMNDDTVAGIRFMRVPTSSTVLFAGDQHVYTGNTIVSRFNNNVLLDVDSTVNGAYNPFGNGGSSGNNRYINPYRNVIVRYETGDVAANNKTLAQWQATTGVTADLTSTGATGTLLYINDATAQVEVVYVTNPTTAPVNHNSANEAGYTTSITGAYLDSQTVPAFGGVVDIYTYPVDGSILVNDEFTGTNGTAITAHTPDVGGAWTLPSGTVTLNGSGAIVASVAGFPMQNPGDAIIGGEFTGQLSATGQLFLIIAFTSTNQYIYGRLSVDTGNSANRVLQIVNRTGGVNTTIGTVTNTGLTTATDYTIKVRRIATNRVALWLNGSRQLDVTSAAIGSNNPTGTTHGLFIPTTGTITNFKIYST